MNTEQFGAQLDAMVDNNLPGLLEAISARCDANVKYIRNLPDWKDKDMAMVWERATFAIDKATTSTWSTLPELSVGERGAF